MEADRRLLLSDSSRSAISLQDPRKIIRVLFTMMQHARSSFLDYIPDESERALHLPDAAEHEDSVSLRSRSSSISTTTDDQASLLHLGERLDSLEGLSSSSMGFGSSSVRNVPRRAQSAAIYRRSAVQPLGEELERIKEKFHLQLFQPPPESAPGTTFMLSYG